MIPTNYGPGGDKEGKPFYGIITKADKNKKWKKWFQNFSLIKRRSPDYNGVGRYIWNQEIK
jgi:hypothetical protein